MLHNEARELLVKGYEKTHNAKMIAQAYGVSESTVYRLVQQKGKPVVWHYVPIKEDESRSYMRKRKNRSVNVSKKRLTLQLLKSGTS